MIYQIHLKIRLIIMTTRRIRKDLRIFFEDTELTVKEKSFVLGCLKAQQKHPQLTSRQWQIVCEIKEKYKNVEILK